EIQSNSRVYQFQFHDPCTHHDLVCLSKVRNLLGETSEGAARVLWTCAPGLLKTVPAFSSSLSLDELGRCSLRHPALRQPACSGGRRRYAARLLFLEVSRFATVPAENCAREVLFAYSDLQRRRIRRQPSAGCHRPARPGSRSPHSSSRAPPTVDRRAPSRR